MGRIRTIKPEFCTSDQVVNCSRDARLLWACMWCFCDDGGVHLDSARKLRMEVFPGDDDMTSDVVARLVDELVAAELLARFTVEGVNYLAVTGWQKHQRIDRPTFKYPRPQGVTSSGDGLVQRQFDEASTNDRRAIDESSTNDRRTDRQNAEPIRRRNGGEGKGMEGRGLEGKQTAASAAVSGEADEPPAPAATAGGALDASGGAGVSSAASSGQCDFSQSTTDARTTAATAGPLENPGTRVGCSASDELQGRDAPLENPKAPKRSRAPAAEVDSGAVVLQFPVCATDGKTRQWALRESRVALLQAAYPGVDVAAECRKAWAWIEANPAQKKTTSGMPRFLNRWMASEQDRAGGRTYGGNGGRASYGDEPTSVSLSALRSIAEVAP